MKIPILVVDASPEFCILIRQTLEETGRYQVTTANTGAEAAEIVSGSDIRLAIIDFGLPDVAGPALIRRLLREIPELAVIAIPLSNDAEDPDLHLLDVDGILSKPFYLPDLPRVIAGALGIEGEQPLPAQAPALGPIEPEPAQVETDPPPPWLADIERAAQYLTRLNLETSSEGALLTRGRRLWAYAGQLGQHQVQELTGVIADHWARDGARGALARFVRLSGSNDDFMLYATTLVGDIVLSLIFNTEVPFGMIRRQAQELAHNLAQVDPEAQLAAGPPPTEPASLEDQETAFEEDVSIEEKPTGEEQMPEIPSDWIPQAEPEVEDLPFFAELAELDLPPPDPEGSPIELETESEQAASLTDTLPLPTDWIPSEARPAAHLPFLEEDPWSEELEEVDALPTREPDSSEGDYLLPYTLVLLPRFPEHDLARLFDDELAYWVERICLAWDWRAEHVEVDAEYMSVTLSLLPEVAPARAVRQLRDDLSARILSSYPELGQDLPSGRFWASPYLLTVGHPPADERLAAFLEDTRRDQGLLD